MNICAPCIPLILGIFTCDSVHWNFVGVQFWGGYYHNDNNNHTTTITFHISHGCKIPRACSRVCVCVRAYALRVCVCVRVCACVRVIPYLSSIVNTFLIVIDWDNQRNATSPLFMVFSAPASTILYHVKISCFLTSYSLWKHHQLSQMNKWPNVIFLKVTLRHHILSFVPNFIICEYLLFLHNTNIFVKKAICFTMVINLVSLIDLYILLIVFNHFVKIRLFFTTFQKTRPENFF